MQEQNTEIHAPSLEETTSLDVLSMVLPCPVMQNAPTLSAVTPGYERLIDNGMMHLESSQAGYSERHSRGETSHTLQVWWARRPHSAMRALTFASLCKETNYRTLGLATSLVSSNTGEESTLADCEQLLIEQYDRRPKVLDMFGGGGTIPLEGVNLGADVSATDINEMSVFIQKCNLEYVTSDRAKALQSLIKHAGSAILQRLKERTDSLYPLRYQQCQTGTAAGPIAYLWTYSHACASCGFRYYVTKRPWLSRKNGKLIRISFDNDETGQKPKIVSLLKEEEVTKTARSKDICCPRCNGKLHEPSIKKFRDEVVALVLQNKGTGKTFALPNAAVVPPEEVFAEIEEAALKEIDSALPSSLLPKWSGIVNPALYGIDTHSDFLNRRQRVVLVLLISEILKEFQRIRLEIPANESKFVLGVLSGLVDQIVDWNCRLSMWIPQNEQVGRAFCGPGVAMLWDYSEADPLLNGPSNLFSKLERIVSGVEALFLKRGPSKIWHASARNLPFADSFFDAIVTDPPYYDNIYYNVLADFFYAWKRLLLSHIEGDLFLAEVTAEAGKNELVASTIRSGSAKAAHEDYCARLAEALNEAARVLKSDGVLSFVYTHAAFGGWTALVHAFRESKLHITSAQPLSIERKARPRAIGSVAVNTCIAFVARKYLGKKAQVQQDELLKSFNKIVDAGFATGLEKSGWQDEDVAMALFAQSVGLLANTSGVAGRTDEEMLSLFEQRIRERFSSFRLKKRSSL